MNQAAISPEQEAQRLLGSARILAVFGILLALGNQLGWALDITLLKSGLTDWPQMLPLTSLGILLCSLSLLLYTNNRRIPAAGLAGLAFCLGAVLFTEHRLQLSLGIDYLLFPQKLALIEGQLATRSSPGTCLNLMLCGTVLLSRLNARLERWTELPLHAIGILGLHRCFGILLGSMDLGLLDGLRTMSLPSSLGILSIYAGTVCLRGPQGALGLLLSRYSGGFFARILLPACVLLPYLVSWLSLAAEHSRHIPRVESAVVTGTLMTIILLSIIIWKAMLLNRIEEGRDLAQLDLRDARSQLSSLFESPMVGVFNWDLSGSIFEVNQTLLKMLGLSREEFAREGLRWDTLTPPEYASLDEEKATELINTGSLAPYEKEFLRRDGSRLPVLLGAEMLDAARRRGIAFVLDNSEVVRQRQLLEQRNRELDSFSYSVSHDLRSPLRAIEGFSKALEEDYADSIDGNAGHYISRIRKGSVRMGAIIDDLLKLSRVSRADLSLSSVDISALAATLAQELDELHETPISWDIEPGIIVRADRQLMNVMLSNLLGNAAKFSSGCTEPRISLQRVSTARGSSFCITDNGLGFDMAYADKLFAPFQRLHTDKQIEGTGIGLATVRRIVDRHGGEISAVSAPGQGASFTITLSEVNCNEPHGSTQSTGKIRAAGGGQ